ncbi:alpha/beta hydrolase [Radiobacillus kanasensis]|uniref:alpha/beta fold hydrolase n=1 Tax=Radiobacillus kanasensis TaxID=2844358 RepID=UPI001E45E865|nr:alpha/beta hydrolase [Radiobacillus kanasensis]UFU00085.1 alpha/beta hydrolase [Radiobacillus kanasensis]
MHRYFINNGEINVHVTEWGDRNNPVIFCLHGLGSTSLSFIEIADKLKDNFRIVAMDAPGHGKTAPFKTSEQYEMPSIVKWLNNILEKLNIGKFYSLSHSWGSFVSLFYLHRYPKKVLGTILIDGGYQTKRLKKQSLEEEVSYYERDFEDYLDTWEQFLEEAVYGAVSRRSSLLDLAGEDLALEKENRFYWHARGTTGGNIVKAMHKHETENIYEELPSNILLLRATLPKDRDNYRDLTSKLFQQKTGGTVNLVPNTSHMLHWDNPDIVVKEIRKRWVYS